jgi:Family of unknown function (DUF6012)
MPLDGIEADDAGQRAAEFVSWERLNSMLLHIRPRLYSPFRAVELIDLEVFPLGLKVGTTELITRRPYPNKRYAVACRRKGHNRAMDGILVKTPDRIDEWRMTARWAVEASLVVTHRVDYKLLDHDFDAASDDMVFWYRHGQTLGGWPDRRPAWWTENVTPAKTAPKMEVIPGDGRVDCNDIIDARGFIIRRDEIFTMPTLEPQRILARKLNERMPGMDVAFRL